MSEAPQLIDEDEALLARVAAMEMAWAEKVACRRVGLPMVLSTQWEDLSPPPQTFDPVEATPGPDSANAPPWSETG